jgi:ketosteroid isomerase-like protein
MRKEADSDGPPEEVTMDQQRTTELAERLLEAWNSQDVDQVLDCYTADVRYRDPNTRGFVEGGEQLRRYLTKLFGRWRMHWSLREAYPLRDTDGAAVLWRASLRLAEINTAVEVEGMDLALLEGERMRRNDVYFDRAALAPLLAEGSTGVRVTG